MSDKTRIREVLRTLDIASADMQRDPSDENLKRWKHEIDDASRENNLFLLLFFILAAIIVIAAVLSNIPI